MNIQRPPKQDKFRAYRARRKAQGRREYRLWGPDVANPQIVAQLRREGEVLRGRKEERDAADFIESAMAETMKDVPY
jgi:hypothetical protein